MSVPPPMAAPATRPRRAPEHDTHAPAERPVQAVPRLMLHELARDEGAVEATAQRGLDRLRAGDPVLHELLAREHRRQQETLTMVAASSIADPAVLACQG